MKAGRQGESCIRFISWGVLSGVEHRLPSHTRKMNWSESSASQWSLPAHLPGPDAERDFCWLQLIGWGVKPCCNHCLSFEVPVSVFLPGGRQLCRWVCSAGVIPDGQGSQITVHRPRAEAGGGAAHLCASPHLPLPHQPQTAGPALSPFGNSSTHEQGSVQFVDLTHNSGILYYLF